MMMKKIYIIENDSTLRMSLSLFLRSEVFKVYPYNDEEHFFADLENLEPGCLLLDIGPAEADRIEVISALSNRRTQLAVVGMSGCADVATAVSAMRAGAVDVIEKPIDRDILIDALARVFDQLDTRVSEHDRRASASDRLAALTGREQDVLRGLTAGRSNKLLAHDFGISVRTVEMHRSSMMDRLGVRTLADALRIAFDGAQARKTANSRAA